MLGMMLTGTELAMLVSTRASDAAPPWPNLRTPLAGTGAASIVLAGGDTYPTTVGQDQLHFASGVGLRSR